MLYFSSRRRHTRLQGDWSSDVCSSDLHRDRLLFAGVLLVIAGCGGDGCAGCDLAPLPVGALPADQTVEGGAQVRVKIGRASCREIESVYGTDGSFNMTTPRSRQYQYRL